MYCSHRHIHSFVLVPTPSAEIMQSHRKKERTASRSFTEITNSFSFFATRSNTITVLDCIFVFWQKCSFFWLDDSLSKNLTFHHVIVINEFQTLSPKSIYGVFPLFCSPVVSLFYTSPLGGICICNG